MSIKNIHFGSYYGSFYRRTQFFMREVFNKFELNFTDGIILNFIHEHPGVIQDDIAHNLSLDKAAVARSLKTLEKQGFLTRDINENNQRTKIVLPSKNSIKYKKAFDKAMILWNQQMMQDLTEQEQELVIVIMEKMKTRAISADMEILLKELD